MDGARPVTRPDARPHPGQDSTGLQEVSAGAVTALVGFTSSFAVVLTGLGAVHASGAQAASGLMALTLLVGLTTLALALAHRLPITVAWSTPGAAVLVGAGAAVGQFSDAVGALLVCALLLIATGLWPWLGRLAQSIPTGIAQAMLAGVLFPLCLQPVLGVASDPWAVLPVILVWLLGLRFAPRWAVPLAFVAAVAVIAVHLIASGRGVEAGVLLPAFAWTWPTLSVTSLIGVALPLYVVTMASQNIPGVAVLRSFGFTAPWRSSLLVTGLGSALAAPLGGHAINLAAISAALAAGEESGVPQERRWRSAAWAGGFYVLLGLGSAAAVVAVAVLAPNGVLAAVAGVALIATLGSAVQGAWEDSQERVAVVATFLVAASGVAFAGISAAFWALVVGLVLRWALARR